MGFHPSHGILSLGIKFGLQAQDEIIFIPNDKIERHCSLVTQDAQTP